MCGIIGGNKKEWNYRKGLDQINHRGPDDSKIISVCDMTLGFVRLAIRDLSSRAMQPMTDLDKEVYVVFNGELYGIDTLRCELQKKYDFLTTSDTEVLLYSYKEYGQDFVNYIDGMFACAIYDTRTNEVILYRDRVGIKPLYYYYNGKDFAFFSEMKAGMSMCSDMLQQYDLTSLYDYFTYAYIPEPKTIYKNVYKLEPAHKIVYHVADNYLESPSEYWTLNINPYQESKERSEDVEEKIRDLVKIEVQKQMVSDVQVGTLLSGGIDSSIITAVAKMQNETLNAFSIGFNVDETTQIFDERAYAKMLADKYGVNLVQEVFDTDELNKIQEEIAEWYDEPFAVASAYPSYFVCELVKKKGITVVLTGDGGDEIFGGYSRYKIFSDLIRNNKVKSGFLSSLYYKYCYPQTKFSNKRILGDLESFGVLVDWYSEPTKRKKLADVGIVVPKDYDDFWYLRKFDNPELPPITRAQYIDFKTFLPSQCLQKMERVSMQWSVEARVPFCSRDIVEYAFSLTEEDRCPKGELKGALRNAYTDIIPNEILNKVKKGFTYPGTYEGNINRCGFEYRKDIFDLAVKHLALI